jgi:ABC-2 type transport system permease protein
MTAATIDRASLSSLSFGGILRSEYIKLVSLRSTVWCFAILVVVSVGFSLLLAAVSEFTAGFPAEEQQRTWVLAATVGVSFGQLVVAVLGVLVITGEYTTGMIRSTITAVPKRLPALLAKAIVIGAVTFVVSLIAILAAAGIAALLLSGKGFSIDAADPAVWRAIVGGAGYLALLSVLALAFGTIIRNSAGAISAVLGLILVLPVVFQIFAGITRAEWAQNIAAFLPDSAGGRMYAYIAGSEATQAGVVTLDPTQGLLVLLAWVVGSFAIAAALLHRRDA